MESRLQADGRPFVRRFSENSRAGGHAKDSPAKAGTPYRWREWRTVAGIFAERLECGNSLPLWLSKFAGRQKRILPKSGLYRDAFMLTKHFDRSLSKHDDNMKSALRTLFGIMAAIGIQLSSVLCYSEAPNTAESQHAPSNVPDVQGNGLFSVMSYGEMSLGEKPSMSTNEGSWTPVKMGLLPCSKVVIKTVEKSHVILNNYSFGQVFKIAAESFLIVTNNAGVQKGKSQIIKLNLQEGHITGCAMLRKRASELDIDTLKNIRARVKNNRRTEYSIFSSGEVCVYSGRVEVSYTNSKGKLKKVAVRKGRMFFPSENDKPAKVDRIPPDKDESRYFQIHDRPIGKRKSPSASW